MHTDLPSKADIVTQIMSLDDAQLLWALQAFVQMLSLKAKFPGMFRPIESTLDLPHLAAQQGYHGTSSEAIQRISTSMDIETPLEELLAMI